VTQQNASSSEEMASTSEELSSQAEQLLSSIEYFNIGGKKKVASSRVVERQSAVQTKSASGYQRNLNCWEFMKCERQPGGSKTDHLGVCLAATNESHDGINDGKYAGRNCWKLSGTLCGGKVQGSFAQKLHNCLQCDFFKYVREQEGSTFQA